MVSVRSDRPLTAREREILSLLTQGLDNPTIAARLFISINTLEHHLTTVYAKLGVSTRYQAALYALHTGLVETPTAPNVPTS